MPLDEPTSRAKPRSTTAQPKTQRQTPHHQPKRGDRDEDPPENHTALIDHIDRPGRVAIAALALPRSLAPEQEERISYDKDQTGRLRSFDSQLAGIDLEKVRAKKDLIMEKSIEDLHAAISRGDLTYEELTAFYLNRIKTYDAGEKGINAVAAINPRR